MRDIWKVLGGVAVGILAVTGVYAVDEDEKMNSIEYDEDTSEEQENEKEKDDDGRLIVREA